MAYRKNEVTSVEKSEKHAQAMYGLWKGRLSKENRESSNNLHMSAENLVAAADDYIKYITSAEVGLYPSLEGFSLYLGVDRRTMKRWRDNPADERRFLLEKFEQFCQEYHNQAGLTGASNTIFEIYYLKSKYNQQDNPNGKTINVNFTSLNIDTAEDVADFIEEVPLMVDDYEDVSEKYEIEGETDGENK